MPDKEQIDVSRMVHGQELRSPLTGFPIIKIRRITDGTHKTCVSKMVYGKFDTRKDEFIRDAKGIVAIKVFDQRIYGKASKGYKQLPGIDGFSWDENDKHVWWVLNPNVELRGRKGTEFYLDGHKTGTWEEFAEDWALAKKQYDEELNRDEMKKAERDINLAGQVATAIVEKSRETAPAPKVSAPGKCQGTTSKGDPCKANAVGVTGFCSKHGE